MAATYDTTKIGSVEIATLANDIKLPSYDKQLTGAMIKKMAETGTGTFTPITTAYKSMMGDFYIAAEMPNLRKDNKVEQQQAAPTTSFGGNKLNTEKYKTGNTIRLEIPKYLVMMFDGKIPKGTKFLFTSLNDKVSAKNMRIIALYNDSPNQLIAEKDLDATPKVLGGGK